MSTLPKCLVTGASGFLGRAVAARLRRETAVAAQAFTAAGTGDTIACDLREPDQVATLLHRQRPGIVVHCAAYRDPDFCETHPEETQRLNVDAVGTLVAMLPPAATFVFISSDYVFAGHQPPYTEDAARDAVNCYGRSKIAAEDIALSRAGSIVLRIPLLIGAGATLATSGFLAQLAATVRDPTPCQQDHVLVRFPTAIDDVAEAITFLLAHQATGIVHVSAREPMTRYQSAIAMARVMQRPHDHIQPSHNVVPRPAQRPHNTQLDTTRIRAMGFEQATPFTDAARAMLTRFGESV